VTGGYRGAGVDLEAAAEAVGLIRDLARRTSRPEVAEAVGGFAGLFRLQEGRLLAAAADGVGTKVEIARRAGRLDTVGIDLVAMCANDVACTGAEPLFFLDYVVVERLIPEQVASLVAGVAEGCRRAGCALLGGETAEHPGHLAEGRFDLAGFCVGAVDEAVLLGPNRVGRRDVLVGIRSSGLHSNGYSLVRAAIAGADLDLLATPEGLARPLVDELLEPTLIYAPFLADAARDGLLHAAAHITGGGLVENVPRALPQGLGAGLHPGSWDLPPVFGFIQRLADVPEEEMRRTFNMGLGMVLVAAPDQADALVRMASAGGFGASVVGEVRDEPGVLFT
jgi:phosphoribosylformylglycinamidine cyclo-ligase